MKKTYPTAHCTARCHLQAEKHSSLRIQ